jgi:predicted transcriptional regulator
MTDDAKKSGGFAAAKEGWLKRIASYPNLSGADLAVAFMLCTYLNTKSRDAWPSMQRLACDTNRSRSTVWRSLKRLETLKLLDITHARSRRKPNRHCWATSTPSQSASHARQRLEV